MSITDTVSTARTFISNFSIPCLYIACASLAAGGSGGYWLAAKIKEGEVARAEQRLDAFRAEQATQANTIIKSVSDAQQADAERLRDRDQSITAAVDAVPAAVARLLSPTIAQLRSATNAPQFDCLRIAYPADALSLLQRPGGSAAASADAH